MLLNFLWHYAWHVFCYTIFIDSWALQKIMITCTHAELHANMEQFGVKSHQTVTVHGISALILLNNQTDFITEKSYMYI